MIFEWNGKVILRFLKRVLKKFFCKNFVLSIEGFMGGYLIFSGVSVFGLMFCIFFGMN